MRHPYSSGWQSTKLHLALIGMLLVTCVYGLAGFPVPAFGEYCLAITGFATAYSASSSAEKFAKPVTPNS